MPIREGFHGTTAAHARAILKDGFRASTGGMLGAEAGYIFVPGYFCYAENIPKGFFRPVVVF